MKNIPIVTCTIGSKSLAVLKTSVQTYAPDVPLFITTDHRAKNFGDAYNGAMARAFENNDEIIISNDDVVLTPTTLKLLLEDVEAIKSSGCQKIGLVGTLCDSARYAQDIKNPENHNPVLRTIDRVSPIFAWINKAAFKEVQFPPLNWYSDDVMCEDLNGKGYTNFLSRAYVHHVGSQTVGEDYTKLNNDALPWLRENRPEYVKKWFGW